MRAAAQRSELTYSDPRAIAPLASSDIMAHSSLCTADNEILLFDHHRTILVLHLDRPRCYVFRIRLLWTSLKLHRYP